MLPQSWAALARVPMRPPAPELEQKLAPSLERRLARRWASELPVRTRVPRGLVRLPYAETLRAAALSELTPRVVVLPWAEPLRRQVGSAVQALAR